MSSKLLMLGSLCLGMGILGFLPPPAAAEAVAVKAWVSIERLEDGLVLLKPYCLSDRMTSLSYLLRVDKRGLGGSSVSKQSGRAELKPNAEKLLSTSSIKLGESDRCRVQLKVMAAGRLVADEDFWLGPWGHEL